MWFILPRAVHLLWHNGACSAAPAFRLCRESMQEVAKAHRHPRDAAWRACAACSSSFMALHDAVVDLQRGRVEYAVVGGSSAIFRPATSLAFLRLKCAWIARQRDH